MYKLWATCFKLVSWFWKFLPRFPAGFLFLARGNIDFLLVSYLLGVLRHGFCLLGVNLVPFAWVYLELR